MHDYKRDLHGESNWVYKMIPMITIAAGVAFKLLGNSILNNYSITLLFGIHSYNTEAVMCVFFMYNFIKPNNK